MGLLLLGSADINRLDGTPWYTMLKSPSVRTNWHVLACQPFMPGCRGDSSEYASRRDTGFSPLSVSLWLPHLLPSTCHPQIEVLIEQSYLHDCFMRSTAHKSLMLPVWSQDEAD